MLDVGKPSLGNYSEEVGNSYMKSIEQSPKEAVSPDTCTILRGEVDIPVYRRFDLPGTQIDRLLTRYAGFYPNEEHPVDKGVYLSCAGDTRGDLPHPDQIRFGGYEVVWFAALYGT